MRQTIDLTGTWRFHTDLGDEGEKSGYFKSEHDAGRWRHVAVPCCFEDCAPGLDFYDGAGWFRRLVFIPAGWKGRRVVIRFEGVNYHTAVWVNGEAAGGSDFGFLCFEIPIHQHLRYGEENLIAVRVDGERRWGELPGAGNSIGWRSYAGILREVALEECDLLRIAQVRINALPGGEFALRASIANGRPQAAATELRVRLRDSAGKVVAELSSKKLTMEAGKAAELEVAGTVHGAEAWSPDHPALYTAAAELACGGKVVDGVDTRFGFRRIETSGDKLLLNGKCIFLTGFNRHEDSPRRGMCSDMETVRQDIADMKGAGANFVRLCHYPHHPGEIDLCDELGMLAMCEIPLYWWNDKVEREHNTAEAKLASARRMLETMILRDINHPSVIFWSVSNETDDRQAAVADGNGELARLARKLDPTRPAVHVSNWGFDAALARFEHDDVVCVNAYPAMWGGCTLEKPEGIIQFWQDHLAALHAKYPGKPILVTEFGHPCIEGEFGGALGEDTAAAVIETYFSGMSAPYVCGAVIWCYADHAWPKADFLHGVTISPFGVVSRDRKKLMPYFAARKIFTQRQA